MIDDVEGSLLREAFELFYAAVGEQEIHQRVESLRKRRQGLSPREEFDTVLPNNMRDRFDWYLYTAQLYREDLYSYDVNSGARIIPTLLALGGREIEARRIRNIDAKLRMAATGKQDIESVLFEVLVACAYSAEGWAVECIPPTSQTKSPDLRAQKGDDVLFIECKRKQKNSEYATQERSRWLQLSRPLFDYLREERVPIVVDVEFHMELAQFADDFFAHVVVPKLRLATPGTVIDDERLTLQVRPTDLRRVREHLKLNSVRSNTTLLPHLLFGDFDSSRGVTSLIESVSNVERPLYVDDVSFAAGAIWSCDATDAIVAKARDIYRDLAKAVDQLPQREACSVHCALEMYDGEGVEAKRYSKILGAIAQFSTDRDLRWVYVHLLGFTIPPDKGWDALETVHMFFPHGGTEEELSNDRFRLKMPRCFVYPSLIER